MSVPHEIEIECPWCDGEGGRESEPYGVNYNDGSPLTHWEICNLCRGSGSVSVTTEPITQDDLPPAKP